MIKIKESKKGTFTRAAKKAGMSVQQYARKILANKEKFSPAIIKKANFARNAAKWKHQSGGKVSKNYPNLFPNITKLSQPDSKLVTANYTKTDSTLLTPLMKKIDLYINKKGGFDNLNEQEKENVNGLLKKFENPELPQNVIGDNITKKLNDDIKEAKITEIGELLNQNYKNFSEKSLSEKIKFALQHKPKSISPLSIPRYAKHMTEGPLATIFQKGGSMGPFVGNTFVQGTTEYGEPEIKFDMEQVPEIEGFEPTSLAEFEPQEEEIVERTPISYQPIQPKTTKVQVAQPIPKKEKVIETEKLEAQKKTIYKSPYEKTGNLGICDEEHCSAFVQKELARNTKIPLQDLRMNLGLRGDAWKIIGNALNQGATSLYKSYDKNFQSNLNSLKPGDVMSLEVGGSEYKEEADKYGHGASHVGIVDSHVKKDNKGRPFVYIVHNMASKDRQGKRIGVKYRDKLYLDTDKLKVSGWNSVAPVEIISPKYEQIKPY